ncbi:protein kinase [Streptomyces sp. W4I9-2]|uniref:protein kinase domain-containing protein n=1 Tax=Streptomyces sp. W4I9-2 TaxID=3042297 RepID=UPI00278107F4|nr:protein kinase [Streptomyces sp. W4I9-2]MDQ0693591.1 serine/threonine protein kinase [Streptomyces sp. W4I9-2]
MLRFVSGILAALDASHARGMVHRDIKPANVMVTADGAVKVMDFGISRALDHQGTALTGTGYTIGTPHYMAPEQFEPGRAVDGRCDLYATGIVLFQLLTGVVPFDADSGFRIGYLHVTAEPPALASLGADVPPEVEALIAQSLAKAPEDRFPNAAAMHAEVERIRQHQSTSPAQARKGATGPVPVDVQATPTPTAPSAHDVHRDSPRYRRGPGQPAVVRPDPDWSSRPSPSSSCAPPGLAPPPCSTPGAPSPTPRRPERRPPPPGRQTRPGTRRRNRPHPRRGTATLPRTRPRARAKSR